MKAKALLNLQKLVTKNAPTILTVAGALGVVGTAVLSSDSALKAKATLDKAEEEKKELSKADKGLVYAKAYAPTVIMGAATIFCIFGSNKISKQRLAAVGAAYLLTENKFAEYKETAEDLLGAKTSTAVQDEIVQRHIDNNPPSNTNVIQSTIDGPLHTSLWYDETSGRYFYSNIEYIRQAELFGQRLVDEEGFCSVNDIYAKLGIPEIPLGDNKGWLQNDTNSVRVTIKTGAALMGPDIPVGTMIMETKPDSAWFSGV